MAGQKYNKAYEAYQQAVYRDGRNPTFWCSIGVLYFQINQFRDALDAYSRAIRINPYISEVWFDLGSLYESCNNQITDAIDAYARAAELDPGNVAIAQRLQLLRSAQATGGQLPAAPGPQDVHPTAYASSVIPPPANLNGPPLMLQPNNHRGQFRSDSRGPPNDVGMPPSSQINPSNRPSPPAPFRGGPPPPVILDESRHIPSHTPLAPMDVDRPVHHNHRDYPISREPARGPLGHQSLLLQHPLPPHGPSDEHRNGAHPHHQDPYYNRVGPRPPSRSTPPSRPRSPTAYQGFPPRQPVGPAQPNVVQPQRSPRPYHQRELSHAEQEQGWDRRPPPGDPREWDLERRRDLSYAPHANQQSYYSRSPRAHSPSMPSPRVGQQASYWDNKPSSAGPPPQFRPSPPHAPNPRPPPIALEQSRSRYDPRQDARESREYDERVDVRSYPVSPEGMRPRNDPPVIGSNASPPTSPHAATVDKNRRRKDREELPPVQNGPPQSMPPQFHPPAAAPSIQDTAPKKERRKRNNVKRKDDGSQEGHKNFERVPSNMPGNFKNYSKGPGSPENSSSSSRSIQPSPTSATPRPPSRVVDDDYEERAVDALFELSGSRATDSSDLQTHSPCHSRHVVPSPRPPASHRNSVSSNRASPPIQATPLKRGLSPGPEELDNNKRSRVDISKRRITPPSGGKHTPVLSTHASPIPLRTQQASRSPEVRDHFPTSPSLPVILPPHPRPLGTSGHVQTHGSNGGGSSSAQIALPPIATLSPPSSAPSPTNHSERDDKMHVDRSLSPPPPRGGKLSDVVHRSSKSPTSKQTKSPPVEKKDASS